MAAMVAQRLTAVRHRRQRMPVGVEVVLVQTAVILRLQVLVTVEMD
jgi:hypothetical protein